MNLVFLKKNLIELICFENNEFKKKLILFYKEFEFELVLLFPCTCLQWHY